VYGWQDGKSGWWWRHPLTPKPLYGLDRLAMNVEAPVLLVEGEKTADVAAQLLREVVAVSWCGGANAVDQADLAPLKGRRVVIWPDHDEPGLKASLSIGDRLLDLAAEVRIVAPPPDLPKGWDLADALPEGLDPAELIAAAELHVPPEERLVSAAKADRGAPFEGEAIDFLAAMRSRDQAAFERTRARLKSEGVRVGALDDLIEKRAASTRDDDGIAGRGRPISLPDVTPWPHKVEGDALLQDILEQLRRFVVLGDHEAVGTALWVVHTYAHDAAFHSPRLAIVSPTRRCGKSSLMRWLKVMVRRGLATSNISAPALFRVIESAYPTLMIDELDQLDPEKKAELVGVVNSSHCRLDACIVRVVQVEGDYEPREFSTWAPMALAAIGKLPPTWTDRSIVISMQRKLSADTVAAMRLDLDQGFSQLAQRAARWAEDHLEELRRVDPKTPFGLNDRQADNWRALLAIADAAGGKWPAKARAAAIALSQEDDAEMRGVMLLMDIKEVFEAKGEPEYLTSQSIVEALVAMEERPWAEYSKGKPLTKNALARALKPFKVEPKDVGPETARQKGYRRAVFLPLWGRYTTAQPRSAAETKGSSDFQTAQPDSDLRGCDAPQSQRNRQSARLRGLIPPSLEEGEENRPDDPSEAPSEETALEEWEI
jgi:hypothetical protein